MDANTLQNVTYGIMIVAFPALLGLVAFFFRQVLNQVKTVHSDLTQLRTDLAVMEALANERNQNYNHRLSEAEKRLENLEMHKHEKP